MAPDSDRPLWSETPLPPTRLRADGTQVVYDERLELLEIRLLLDAISERYGYDFRDYQETYVRNRMRDLLRVEGFGTYTALQERLLHDPRVMDRLISAMSIEPAPFFDPPEVFSSLRRNVMPELRTNFFSRIWQVGCASGERAYSTAIVSEEEGLGDKYRIYVTDVNGAALRRAKQGLYPLAFMDVRRKHYATAGGKRSFAEYYAVTFDNALMDSKIRKKMVFAQHNLVTDASFNEFHLIIALGIQTRFNPALKNRVFDLYHASLAQNGFVILGAGESPPNRLDEYVAVDEAIGLFQRLS